MRIIFCTLVLASVVSGCSCLDRCRPDNPTNVPVAKQIPQVLRTNEIKTTRSGTGIPIEMKDAASLGVGVIIDQLRLLVSDLANLVQTVGGETRASIVQLEGSTAQLAAEMDARFKDRLNESVDKLDGLEKRMVQGAVAVINQTTAAANQLRAGAEESAFVTIQEANISSYEALSELPCNVKERVPRLVYTLPKLFRIWGEDVNPGGASNGSRTLELKTRGNFISSFGSVTVKVNGVAASAISSRNDLVITVPDEVVKKLQLIQSPTTLQVEAVMTGCQGTQVLDKQFVTVRPPIKYSVAVRTTPVIDVPIRSSMSFHFDETGGCDSDYRVDRRYPVGPPPKAIGHSVSGVNGNCGSTVNSHYIEGEYGVTVQAQIKGCGKDCLFGVCNCKGRGWLSYDLQVITEEYGQRQLPIFEGKSTLAQSSYIFPYPYTIPGGKNLKCRYYGRIRIEDGANTKVVEISDDLGPVDGVTHSADATCGVGVTIPSAVKVRR